jgi:putative transposase
MSHYDDLLNSSRRVLSQFGREELKQKGQKMEKMRHTPEQVVNLLRQIEEAVANGKTTTRACKEAAIREQTYYRWRKEYGGLQVDQAQRLQELELENEDLKRLVSELSLQTLVLKDIVCETSKL